MITNTCAQNYKFTGLERDSETGNDHTLFRQYASNLGRWLSPDPLGGDVTNPQSLNRYAYVLNNPTNFIDPLGLNCKVTDTCGANGGAGYNDARGYYQQPCPLGGMDPGCFSQCYVNGLAQNCSFAYQLLNSGLAAQCPNSDCTNIIFPNNGYNEIYRLVFNENLTLNCFGTDFVVNPDYTCAWSNWSKQFVQNADDMLFVGDARGRFIFGVTAQLSDKPTKAAFVGTGVAIAAPFAVATAPEVYTGGQVLAGTHPYAFWVATQAAAGFLFTTSPVVSVPAAVGRGAKFIWNWWSH